MPQEIIQQAVDLLQSGKLIGLPTETVYGLGADARNPEAIAKIFLAKERPFTHPLIVHLASFDQVKDWAISVPPEAEKLAQAFWPGPLTLILKKRPEVSELLTGGQDTIGLRVPAHPVALAVLQEFKSGIAAPSANRFSRISPTTANAVREELGSKVDLVLEGGTCDIGIESTILDLSRAQPTILRPGMITRAEVEQIIQKPVSYSREDAPRVSGMDHVHYAPETSLVMIATHDLPKFIEQQTELPIAVITTHKPLFQREGIEWIVMSGEPHPFAHELYITLRELDKQGFKKIIIEEVPQTDAWLGICDRISRGAAKL